MKDVERRWADCKLQTVPILVQFDRQTDFRVLQQLGYEQTILTPMAWVDIYRRQYTLREQLDPFNRLQQAARADSVAFLADQLAATHYWEVPFSVTSTASQIGMAAWSVSALSQFHPALSP